jgi:hypothetical protein
MLPRALSLRIYMSSLQERRSEKVLAIALVQMVISDHLEVSPSIVHDQDRERLFMNMSPTIRISRTIWFRYRFGPAPNRKGCFQGCRRTGSEQVVEHHAGIKGRKNLCCPPSTKTRARSVIASSIVTSIPWPTLWNSCFLFFLICSGVHRYCPDDRHVIDAVIV